MIRQEEKNIWSLVPMLFLFNISNIGCCRVVFVWQHWMIDFDIDHLWYWKWLISTMIYMDNGHWRNGWYEQWTSKIFGQGTLTNILNTDNVHTRISAIVPDTNLDTYPQFLIEQCSEGPVPVSNCWCSNVGPRYFACYYYTAPQQSVIATCTTCTTCPSVRSLGFNGSRTLLHVLLSKLLNSVTPLPSFGLYTG